ncbi:MAG: hypothetical protein JWP04_2703 [Belnapia sp.]|nr:hypothetical protein [Belnapia sp.]
MRRAATAILLILALAACEANRPATRAGETLDRAGSRTGEAVGRAANSTGAAIGRAGDWVRGRTQ